MAYLKNRSGNYYIVFKTRLDSKTITKRYSLGTKRKTIAEQKRIKYQKLYEKSEINPFSDDWNLKEFEKARERGSIKTVNTFIPTVFWSEELRE